MASIDSKNVRLLPPSLYPGKGEWGVSRRSKTIAYYQSEAGEVEGQIFDRATGELASAKELKTYLDVLAQYHLHPESKFLNGDYCHKGRTQRRYIQVQGFDFIGKEADKWEEQYFLGRDVEKQICHNPNEPSL